MSHTFTEKNKVSQKNMSVVVRSKGARLWSTNVNLTIWKLRNKANNSESVILSVKVQLMYHE